MRAFRRCMLALTILLLMCEVAISHLCKSLITMVDGFHTLFILMHMALPLPQPASTKGASDESQVFSYNPNPPPPVSSTSTDSSVKSQPGIQSTTSTQSGHPPTPDPSPVHAAPLQDNSNQLFPSMTFTPKTFQSPPAPWCGLSYAHVRIQTVGAMISALLLTSLCVSYCMKILSHTLQPHPMQRPLMATVVGALGLLHKLLLLGLSQGLRAGAVWEIRSPLGAKRKAPTDKPEEEAKHHAVQGRVVDDVSQVPSAVDGSLHNGTLVLCNPGTSSVPDSDSPAQTQKPPPGVPPGCGLCCPAQTACVDSARLASHSQDCEKVRKCEVYSNDDLTETSRGSTCMGHLDNQNSMNTSSVCKPNQYKRSSLPRTWSGCLLWLVRVTQDLLSSVLALINGLVMLLMGPECLHSSQPCSFLIYLDPALSLVAVIALLATAVPQVYRYGLLLLQVTPPQICVSDLGRRIASVPGVQAVHDLHIWQLTDTCTVASVHVHCHPGFQTHRCGDLTSGVTRVFQSVGVSCCTVQPEFLPSSAPTHSSLEDVSSSLSIIHRETVSLPPLLTCSLACGKDCAEKMCCSAPAQESREPLAPSAGETEEEPQMLVIENTFL